MKDLKDYTVQELIDMGARLDVRFNKKSKQEAQEVVQHLAGHCGDSMSYDTTSWISYQKEPSLELAAFYEY